MNTKKLLLLAPLCLATSVWAQLVSLPASDSGWYDSYGYHDTANTSYVTGQGYDLTRSFFVFDLPTSASSAIGASLRLYNPAFGYDSPDSSETFSLFEVTSDLDQLMSGAGGLAAFQDLGDGALLGSVDLTPSNNDGWITISLSPALLSQLQGGAGRIALGGALTSLDPSNTFWNELVFAFSDSAEHAPTLDLQIAAVPEPSTYALGGIVLAAFAFLHRRTRRSAQVSSKA